jgi:hypothetical protein
MTASVTASAPGQLIPLWSPDRREGTKVRVLTWEKPPPEQPYGQWASYQADSTPPGTYVPNMDDGWKASWKAVLRGQRGPGLRVEIRKSSSIRRGGSVQVKIVVSEDGSIQMSMNGTAEFTGGEFRELGGAIGEAMDAMCRYRQRQGSAND